MWLTLKDFAVVTFIICTRAALPRPRFDQVMAYGWKVLFPLSLANLLLTGVVVLWLDGGAS